MNRARRIVRWMAYEIELITQLVCVVAAAWIYGWIEAKYVPTDQMQLPLLGKFSYYHLGLLGIMTVVSFTLSMTHIQWMFGTRKRYVLLVSTGSLPLALMIEDLAWFVTLWRPIKFDEWTMIKPGLGINLGFSWIPLWYVIVLAFSITMFWLAGRAAEAGFRRWEQGEATRENWVRPGHGAVAAHELARATGDEVYRIMNRRSTGRAIFPMTSESNDP